MDALPPSCAELMLRGFWKTTPTNILLVGADLLLSLSFRGVVGGLKMVLGGLTTVPAQDAQGAPPYGPLPISNSEFGLSTTPACTAPPMLHLLDVVHKGDSQKVDTGGLSSSLAPCLCIGLWGPKLSSLPPGRGWAAGGLGTQLVKHQASFRLAGVHVRLSAVWSQVLEAGRGGWCEGITGAPGQPTLASQSSHTSTVCAV